MTSVLNLLLGDDIAAQDAIETAIELGDINLSTLQLRRVITGGPKPPAAGELEV